MASILKVDEMQGVTSAGDITITSEGGSATTVAAGAGKGMGLTQWLFRSIAMTAINVSSGK